MEREREIEKKGEKKKDRNEQTTKVERRKRNRCVDVCIDPFPLLHFVALLTISHRCCGCPPLLHTFYPIYLRFFSNSRQLLLKTIMLLRQSLISAYIHEQRQT